MHKSTDEGSAQSAFFFALPSDFRTWPAVEQIGWLNELYQNHPVHPSPPVRTDEGFRRTAEWRLSEMPPRLRLRDSSLLEIGCGTGHFAEVVAPRVRRYVGVDIASHDHWDKVASRNKNVSFHNVDLTNRCEFCDQSFDVAVSWVVWEHLQHPKSMLRVARRLLRPGGHLIFKANVFTSAIASHLYRDIYFPWPHLLFRDCELVDFVRQKWISDGKTSAQKRCEEDFPTPCLYVNRLTLANYLQYFELQRWHVLSLRKIGRDLDEVFYRAFESELGRYPRSDLCLDFFTAILRKPRRERAYRMIESLFRLTKRLTARFI